MNNRVLGSPTYTRYSGDRSPDSIADLHTETTHSELSVQVNFVQGSHSYLGVHYVVPKYPGFVTSLFKHKFTHFSLRRNVTRAQMVFVLLNILLYKSEVITIKTENLKAKSQRQKTRNTLYFVENKVFLPRSQKLVNCTAR